MKSLIDAESTVAVMAGLFTIATVAFWAERQPWGRLLTGAVWCILLSIAASNLGVLPQSSEAYDFVFAYFVPVLIPLFLLRAKVGRIVRESGRVGLAFGLACVGTTLGALAASRVVDLGPRAGDLAGIFTATYTGGSVNFAAVSQATGFDQGAVLSAATAVDNLMSALFLAGLAVAPGIRRLADGFIARDHGVRAALPAAALPAAAPTQQTEAEPVAALQLTASLAFAAVVVALSDGLVAGLDVVWPGAGLGRLRYVWITVLTIVPVSVLPERTFGRSGEALSLCLAFVFFAAIAAGADVAALLGVAPQLIGYVFILLAVHLMVLFGGALGLAQLAKARGRPDAIYALALPEVLIASNAAVLGATTAPALAVARGWPALATPGVLVGVAGYILGTPLGIAVAAWLSP